MKETQSEAQRSERNRREALPPGQRAMCPHCWVPRAHSRAWPGPGAGETVGESQQRGGPGALEFKTGDRTRPGAHGRPQGRARSEQSPKGGRYQAGGWGNSMAGRGKSPGIPEEGECGTRGSQGGCHEAEALRKGPRVELQNIRARETDPDRRSVRSCGRILRGETEPFKKSPRASSIPSTVVYKRAPSDATGHSPSAETWGWAKL